MTTEYLTKLTTRFKEMFPYYDKNADVTIDDAVIEKALTEAEQTIITKCKNIDDILCDIAMHLILKRVEDGKAFVVGEFEQLDKMDGYKVGDIQVKFDSSDKNGLVIPVWWSSTRYGIRAYELLIICSKSRLGLIV